MSAEQKRAAGVWLHGMTAGLIVWAGYELITANGANVPPYPFFWAISSSIMSAYLLRSSRHD